MCNAHGEVIDHHCELISGDAIWAHEDKIVEFLVVKGHCPADEILNHGRPHGRGLEPEDPAWSRPYALFTTGAIVLGLSPLGQGLLSLFFQELRRTLAIIGLALFKEFLGVFPVDFKSFHLEIGAFIPVEPEPLQGFPDGIHKLWPRTLLISVLETQEEKPSVVSGKGPVEEGRPGPSEMEVPCGTGWKACLYLLHHGPLF